MPSPLLETKLHVPRPRRGLVPRLRLSERLDRGRDVHEGMAFLLDHLPPRLHLVIASRTDPALALARLRARGELAEIRAAELRFRRDKTGLYLDERWVGV
jgi:ATP/maltotriose-dependent transcriptional regulator MalT